jgi:hypothetical protein
MGRRWSFELFYPAAQVEAGLHAMRHYQLTSRRKRTARPIKSSGGFDPHLISSRLTPDAPFFLNTSLLFPADEHVRAFRSDWNDRDSEWDDEGNESLPVDGIDVAIRTSERYALFTYTAVAVRVG